MLREIPESWYVEYKRQINDGKMLAKSISALANTYGGWLIIGVEESDGDESVATGFPGLDSNELSRLQQQLGESINARLQPVPHYEHRVLNGPCEPIGLAPDRSVVVVHVPMSVRTPHIHSDGRVYERVGDTSQPRHVAERHRLDELWRRGDQVRDETADWIAEDLQLSKAEDETPYLRLMLLPDPWNKKHRLPSISVSRFQELLNEPGTDQIGINFDSVYSTNKGFVARHVHDNHPRRLGLTMKIATDYSCDVIVPLNIVSHHSDQLLEALPSQYEYAERYVRLLNDRSYTGHPDWPPVEVVDLNPLLNVLFAITSQYRGLLRLVTADLQFQFKACCVNMWRRFPFLDVPHIIDDFSQHGVPMLMNDEILVPQGEDPDTFGTADCSEEWESPLGEEFRSVIDQSMQIFLPLLYALGVSRVMDGTDSESDGFTQALVAASQRAVPLNITNAPFSR